MLASSAELRNRIVAVRRSGLFDEAAYELRAEAALRRQDPVLHYLTSGEARGAKPSRLFDPAYYKKKYGISGDSPLIHYLMLGRRQGFRPRPIANEFKLIQSDFRSGFRRVAVVLGCSDPASPMAGEYRWALELQEKVDVILVHLNTPEHVPAPEEHFAFKVFPHAPLPQQWTFEADEAHHFARLITEACVPDSVAFTGHASYGLIQPFSRQFLPTVLLADVYPAPATLAAIGRTLGHTSSYVFPSPKAMEQHVLQVPTLRSREVACPSGGSFADATPYDPGLVLKALSQARLQMNLMIAEHAELTRRPDLMDAISKELGDRQEIQERVRENLLVRGRDTGKGPIATAPKLFLSQESAHRLSQDEIVHGATPLAGVLRKLALQAPVRRTIRPMKAEVPLTGMQVALHGHYFYPDLFAELLDQLAGNRHEVDLFLSTDTDAKRKELEGIAKDRCMDAEVRVFPNRGRDVAPLFVGFRDLFEPGRYDVVGHVHSKKSPRISRTRGDSWRKSLLSNVIGGRFRMMDIILDQLARDERTGLIFPAIANFCAWDGNYRLGVELAERMRLVADLTRPFFDYPAGMMFWTRPRSVRPLIDLKLSWEDYPAEPTPNDGTMAHAIERLLPFICESQGFECATTWLREAS